MTTSTSRSVRGNVLKAMFNKLWDLALNPSAADGKPQGVVTYRDMSRIADALRHEGPQILQEKELPAEIEAGLRFAIAVTDPTSQRVLDALTFTLSSLSGATGVSIIIIALTHILHPGVWAVIVTAFAGSHVAGPVAAIGAGLALVVTATYVAYQKFTPTERAVWAHRYVTRCIESWVSRDDKHDRVRQQTEGLLHKIETQKLSAAELPSDTVFIALLREENARIKEEQARIRDRIAETERKLVELLSED